MIADLQRLRLEREAAADLAEKRAKRVARTFHLIRWFCALALILAAYKLGYAIGYATGLLH